MRHSVFLLLSLCAVIVGCSKAEDGVDAEIGAYSLFDPVATNPSLCGGPAIPFPNNALFADSTQPTGLTPDTTLNIPSTASTAVAANLTDGWSTTASAFTDILGEIDFASASNGGIIVLEADATPRILVPGVDYQLQTSTAMAQASGTGGVATAGSPGCGAINPFPSRFLPISQQRTRVLIEPLHPLAASTTYIVAVTRSLLSADGVPVTANEFFPVMNSDTKLCRLSGAETTTEPLCTDVGAGAVAAAAVNAPVLGNLDPAGAAQDAATAAQKLATVETLRRNLVRPTVSAFKTLATAVGGPTLADSDFVIAWSFTTQAISASLATINGIATAKAFTVANSGLSTGDLDLNGDGNPGDLPDTANIWLGTIDAVPYYLDDASGVNDAASQLNFWRNDGTVTAGPTGVWPAVVFDHDANPATPSIPAPCSGAPFGFVRPLSTTNCYRIPTAGGNDATGNPAGSLENLPVIITVPMTAKPGTGWPVVIFQHGITGNRTNMLPLGATLAAAGMVTIAIDLPLHGVMPGAGFYAGAGAERTFDLDISAAAAGNACLSAPGGDGTTDPSGTCFINLGSLITSRDNLRQAVADLLHLSRSLGDANLDFDGGGNDLNTSRIHFAGMSLGGIVGTTLLGVDAGGTIKASSLNVPGGGLGKLLDASASFGPVIAAGLAGTAFSGAGTNGTGSPFEGTDTYETFVRFAQHLTDPGDPINYAVAANASHRIHMIMVNNDTVVPNSAFSTCPDPSTFTLGIGATSFGNTADPLDDNSLIETRAAACKAGVALVGTNSTTQAACFTPPAPAPIAGLCAGNAAQDETLISGFLSGTEPLYTEMGLTVAADLTPPTMNTTQLCTGLDIVVPFAIGAHNSLLVPTASAAVTTEMQRQTATYLANNGTTLGAVCP
jgi:dienelactone hydrolase